MHGHMNVKMVKTTNLFRSINHSFRLPSETTQLIIQLKCQSKWTHWEDCFILHNSAPAATYGRSTDVNRSCS